PPLADRRGYEASIIDKHRILDRACSPKIVLVGGSNLAFGVDSERLQAATGLDVVNMGVNRYFGLRYCLEEVKDSIKPGDIIVIAAEYENFYGGMYGSAHLMNVPLMYPRSIPWLLRAYASEPLRACDLGLHLYGVVAGKANEWRRNTSQSIAEALPNPAKRRGFGYWANFDRAHFTKYGDFIGHVWQTPPKHKDLRFLADGQHLDWESFTIINRFNDFAMKKGATVVLLPPPLAESAYIAHRDTMHKLYQLWKENLNVIVASPPERYVFADSCFFNNVYHLFGNSREMRTTFLIQDLQAPIKAAVANSRTTTQL
ncbi:MAG: hypothetical protein ACRDHZ_11415, partial [Ktedonobacteraceae bacterium]